MIRQTTSITVIFRRKIQNLYKQGFRLDSNEIQSIYGFYTIKGGKMTLSQIVKGVKK